MNLLELVRGKNDYVTSANRFADNFTFEEEAYRQIAAIVEKAWREVSVTQSFYDDYIRADLEQIKHD